MKIKHYTTTTVTTAVETIVPDDADEKTIDYHARVARTVSGYETISEKEETWYVIEDEEEVPKFGNPLHL